MDSKIMKNDKTRIAASGGGCFYQQTEVVFCVLNSSQVSDPCFIKVIDLAICGAPEGLLDGINDTQGFDLLKYHALLQRSL